jgi:hypothetical protein
MTREEAEKLYVIWHTRYEQYWRPEAAGYTGCILTAGLFTKEEAERHTHRPEDHIIPLVDELRRIGDCDREYPKTRESCVGWALGVLR